RTSTAPSSAGVVWWSPRNQYSPGAVAEPGRVSYHLHPLDLGRGVGVAIDDQPAELVDPLAQAAPAAHQLDGSAAQLVAGEALKAVALERVVAPLELDQQLHQQVEAIDLTAALDAKRRGRDARLRGKAAGCLVHVHPDAHHQLAVPKLGQHAGELAALDH